uniref:Uncharacterized protein n=1 Tax=Oryza brachyantha TaxID=4533 RepID=J3N229_ORYBR
MPALLAPAIVDGGFCFGPLDAVSNIIANAVRHLPPSGAHVEEFGMREGFTKDGDGEGFGMSHPFANEAVQRSIKALVGFLAFYFRYLPTLEAQHYLFAAKGDLLAAVHLVEAERCTGAFDVGSHTTKTALRCAAGAAGHADLDSLVTAMRSLSDERTLERCTKSLERVLLDKIHGFYLEALALLPQDQLRRRYHRSVVMAGHCYGPLDPVSNIVLNTIWYDAAFPVPNKKQQPELDMVGRWALIRAERRCLVGLVAGLRAFAGDHGLSEVAAIRCLLRANGDFATAMSVLQPALLGHRQPTTMPSESELHRLMAAMAQRLELYRVMAVAAQHPSPDRLHEFLLSDRVCALRTPWESRRFSREDVRSVIRSLDLEPPPPLGMPSELLRLTTQAQNTIKLFPDAKKRFCADMSSFHRKAKAALDDYVLQNMGPEYVMHVVCGANEMVADRDGPEYSSINWPLSFNKLHYSHINFLASPVCSSAADMSPTLFFAECVNYNEESDRDRKNICCPVVVPPTNAERVRCFYCEYNGMSIIHPVDGNYHGCDIDFEKLARQQHKMNNSIESVFNRGNYVTNSNGPVQEDYFYFDHARELSV